MIEKIIKRDGSIQVFDSERIKQAIKKAMLGEKEYDEEKLNSVVSYVINVLEKNFESRIPHVEQVQDIVEISLMKHDLYNVAKSYILYRRKRESIREEKKAILKKETINSVDKMLSLNSIRILASRYLTKDSKGEFIEEPKQIFDRVAMLAVIPDILYDKRVFTKKPEIQQTSEEFIPEECHEVLGFGESKWNKHHMERMKCLYDELNGKKQMRISWKRLLKMIENGEFSEYEKKYNEYFETMVLTRFLPNSPTLFNAGNPLGQLSACFVLNIEDDMNSIMDCAKEAAIIFKSGGGIGINYSKLRPSGEMVKTTSGVASGPISFMRINDVITEVIKQGGKRRGANMGVLEVWHPNMAEFIHVKEKEGFLTNFNISVMFDDKFWEAYQKKKSYEMINPKNGNIATSLEPEFILNEIANIAWRTGDPGVLFKDNINRRNVMREYLGDIISTNPCGEEPLYPYESCNLGSIDLNKFATREGFNWEGFKDTIRIATRFLDNILDMNNFPIDKIEKNTKATRKIGLGLMGVADTLFTMEVPYNSEEGFEFMRKATEFLTYHSMIESHNLSLERGVFPLYPHSGYVKGDMPLEGFYSKSLWSMDWKVVQELAKKGMRNAEVTTMAPTGSISMIADTSSGIEPQFALLYEKVVPIGSFYTLDNVFRSKLNEYGMDNDEVYSTISQNGGSIMGLKFPEKLRRVFITSLDIPWWDHIRAQAEINKWVCAAVSKTINMPSWAKAEDVLNSYLLAYKLGCKGITVYRDGSKSAQVIYVKDNGKNRQEETMRLVKNNTQEMAKSLGIKIKLRANDITSPKHVGDKKCPVCNNDKISYQSGCVSCPKCGWSECAIA